MTAEQAANAQQTAPQGTVTLNGFAGITGTGWQIAAAGTKKGADEGRITPDDVYQYLFHLPSLFQCLSSDCNNTLLFDIDIRFFETTTISSPEIVSWFFLKLSRIKRLTRLRPTAVRMFLFDIARPRRANFCPLCRASTRNWESTERRFELKTWRNSDGLLNLHCLGKPSR